jgi:Ca2+-binding EF-hand superfamily protein
VKSNWMFSTTIAAVLLIGTIVGVTNASGQETSSNLLSGAKLWLTAMDKDKDGTVSKEEFTAYMEAQFDKADADHDGTLDRNELEQLRKSFGITTASTQKTSSSTSSGPRLSMTALDKDNDGTASKEEFTAYMRAQFDKADADHDGTLDIKESEQLRKSLGISAKR